MNVDVGTLKRYPDIIELNPEDIINGRIVNKGTQSLGMVAFLSNRCMYCRNLAWEFIKTSRLLSNDVRLYYLNLDKDIRALKQNEFIVKNTKAVPVIYKVSKENILYSKYDGQRTHKNLYNELENMRRTMK